MALRIRKDIKKSSYYVWFLGAKESKGIRGKEFILPVIEHLVQREKEIEPFKVTLQISHKGLKIIQNVLSTNPKTSKPKNETIKHFIPHNTITCVYQDDDVVSCILLLYNPVTKCPLHVHVYRCDSNETATLLKSQLEVLIERPENQKKFQDLEARLMKPVEVKKKFDSSIGSDTGTSTRESESSEERFPSSVGMSSLYDSLAAELRQKLRKNSPILLPPRDYDTVHRQRGNLSGIDTRRCLTASVVGPQHSGPPGSKGDLALQGLQGLQGVQGLQGGQSGQSLQGGQQGVERMTGHHQGVERMQSLQRRIESSGGSSGIGSDHAPSPESEGGNYLLDNQSTSDEEWNTDQTDSTLYLMHGSDMILPRASRHPESNKFSPEPPKSPTYHADPRFQRYPDDHGKYHEKPSKEVSKYPERHGERDRQERLPERIPEKYPENSGRFPENPGKYPENSGRVLENPGRLPENHGKYPEKYPDAPGKRYERYESNGREKDYPDRDKYLQRYPEERSKYHDDIPGKYPGKYEESNNRYPENSSRNRSSRYHDDFEEEIEYNRQSKDVSRRSNNNQYMEGRFYEEERPSRLKYDPRYYPQEHDKRSKQYYQEFEEYHPSSKQKYPQTDDRQHYYGDNKTLEKSKKYDESRYSRSTKYQSEEPSRSSKYAEDFFDDIQDSRRRPEDRQRSPTPPELNVSPKDRFKDAKEKFLLLERERTEAERLQRQEMHHSVPNLKDKTFLKRHDSMAHPNDRLERFDDRRFQPKPAPRTILEEERYRREPLERYRSPERYEKNRRSLYNQIEDDHKAKSNEIAKELKRRSYLDPSSFDKEYYRDDIYRETPEKRYSNLEKESYHLSSKSNIELDKLTPEIKFSKPQKIKQPAGYRHSYAEPKLSMEKMGKKIYPEMVHRTNSSVSNSGRVGLASVNPY